MSCANIQDQIHKETGRFNGEIHRRLLESSPWFSMVPKGAWQNQMGKQLNTLTYEPNAPSDSTGSDWNDLFQSVESSPVEGGSCILPAEKIDVSSTVRNYKPQYKAVEGPDICLLDATTAFQMASQLSNVVDVLTFFAQLVWEYRIRSEYLRLTAEKVVVQGASGYSFPTGTGTNFDSISASPPDAGMDLGILEYWYQKLLLNGGLSNPVMRTEGTPVAIVITDYETAEHIKTANAAYRQDLRDGDVATLLRPLGVRYTIKNFVILSDLRAKRFTESGGSYTEVNPYTLAAATKNSSSAEVNSAFLAAPYTTTHIFHPDVLRLLFLNPNMPGGSFNFDPQNFSGMFEFMNIQDRVCNPKRRIGYHLAEFVAASEPVAPWKGVSFVHKRCTFDRGDSVCYT